tara:strand:- start:262 stop:549 length:288 start_codon:yes stop_codon:yes gene_type:complete
MINKISIDIQEKSGIIYCTIKAPRQNYQFPKKVILNDQDVEKILLEKGYKRIALLKGSHINNKGAETPCEGTWEFKKLRPPARKKRSTKTKNTKE